MKTPGTAAAARLVGYVLTILSVLLAFGLVVGSAYGKTRAARRRAGRRQNG